MLHIDASLREVIAAARKKIDTREKWGQGLRTYRLETCCAAEAIEDVVPHSTIRRQAYRLIKNLASASKYDNDISYGIIEWNDAPETSYEDVKQVFDHAYAIVKDFK